MIEPQAGRLIARVCAALEKAALADTGSPYAQRQLKAALWTLRDLASRIDAQPGRVREDIADMELALTALGAPCGIEPGLTDIQRHLQLQARIEALEAASPAPELRALHIRMLARDESSRSQRAGDGSGYP